VDFTPSFVSSLHLASVKQKPNLPALITLITDVLPTLTEDWPYDLATLQITRNYLEHTLQLLLAGRRTASETDYMPLEALRVLTSRYPVAFWIPDSAQPDEVWMTTDSGLPGDLTMSTLQRLVGGSHIAFSRRHFFQLEIDPAAVQTLLDAVLGTHAQITSNDPILPMEVEEGALLVQSAGADWVVALSRQHRQRLRRDPTIALEALISTQLGINDALWAAVEGNGYYGSYRAPSRSVCSTQISALRSSNSFSCCYTKCRWICLPIYTREYGPRRPTLTQT
jgi:hypothetical protein